jgi:hypothetical protein
MDGTSVAKGRNMPVHALRDRMFHVIVLGGIGLLGLEGCGKVANGAADDADAATPDAGSTIDGGVDAFPSESGAPAEDGGRFDAFPSETATFIDASPHEGLDSSSVDAFPTEGPAMIDSGPIDDAAVDAECFPEETAVQLDASSCPRIRRPTP